MDCWSKGNSIQESKKAKLAKLSMYINLTPFRAMKLGIAKQMNTGTGEL
jgi:hypothetical protein